MKGDQLIAALVADLDAVTPLPLAWVRAARWALAAVASIAMVVLAIGFRPEPWQAGSGPPARQLAWLIAIAIVSALLALRLTIPGERVPIWSRVLPAVATGVWCAWIAMNPMSSGPSDVGAWVVDAGWACVAKVVAAAAIPAVLIMFMIRRGDAAELRTAMGLAALGAGAAGAAAASLTCPITHPAHILLWHAGPLPALALTATIAGGVLLAAAGSSRVNEPA